ncbi:MAG: sigma-70 family RNA polymerase sigma factor [Phycisphaerae bacterium]
MGSSHTNQSDSTRASLLVRVRDSSDAAAWRELEARYSTLLKRYCRRRGIGAADIDDICQIAWSKLAQGLRNFQYDPSKGRFRGYLYQVLRSAISRQFAHRGNDATWLASHEELANLVNSQDSEDDLWEQEWTDHHFRIAFQTVEDTFDPQNVAIFRRLLAGSPVSRIAEEFGVTPAAINQSKHRIRTRMRELIELQVLEEDDPESFGQRRS